jgi:hypothetical protein
MGFERSIIKTTVLVKKKVSAQSILLYLLDLLHGIGATFLPSRSAQPRVPHHPARHIHNGTLPCSAIPPCRTRWPCMRKEIMRTAAACRSAAGIFVKGRNPSATKCLKGVHAFRPAMSNRTAACIVIGIPNPGRLTPGLPAFTSWNPSILIPITPEAWSQNFPIPDSPFPVHSNTSSLSRSGRVPIRLRTPRRTNTLRGAHRAGTPCNAS